jgi:hypothetical protein
MGKLRIGEVLRYDSNYAPEPTEIDGLPNYFFAVFTPGKRLPLLSAGINPIAEVRSADGPRLPAILISSSPHTPHCER